MQDEEENLGSGGYPSGWWVVLGPSLMLGQAQPGAFTKRRNHEHVLSNLPVLDFCVNTGNRLAYNPQNFWVCA
jgi:hypothetical protein